MSVKVTLTSRVVPIKCRGDHVVISECHNYQISLETSFYLISTKKTLACGMYGINLKRLTVPQEYELSNIVILNV